MTENRDFTETLRDISLLYELSLSVGRSLDLDANCRTFLETLMARKSLDYTSVWIRADLAQVDGEGSGLRLVYATPAFRASTRELPDSGPIDDLLGDEPFMSVAHGDPGFATLVAESGIDRGAYALFRLGDTGVLKIYSISRRERFPRIELSKLLHVVEKFTISLCGCLDHARVRSEQERRLELEQQVLYTQKLESLGLMASGIAHDFNNLLAVILGNVDLLRPSVPSDAQDDLQHLERAAVRAAGLCSQLLAYSGRGRVVNQRFDLSSAVREMVELSAVTVSKKAQLRSSFSTELPRLDGDRGQIGQVVMNLISNASDALGDRGGALAVTTGVVEVEPEELAEFHLGDQIEPGKYIFLEVSDSGCGMDTASLTRLFDPFFTTKFTGRGLGLAAVLGIVRSHAGAIRVSSTEGRGTTVRILFPPAGAEADTPPAPTKPATALERCGTVLVVDDEPSIRAVLGRILEGLGFEVRFAVDGGAAVRDFREHASSIDIVVLDYTMPVLDGYEALVRIRQVDPGARVLLTSGVSDADPTERLDGPRPTAFLRKPFLADELERLIYECLATAPSKSH